MKGFWRKVLLTMGFAPLLYFFNEFYLKPKNAPQPVAPIQKEVRIVVEDHRRGGAPAGEFKKLKEKVARKSTEAELLERIQDFSKNAKEIVPNLKPEWQKEGKDLLKQLEDCQGRDYCGMSPDDDGYFDESETHARKHQLRLLELLNASYEESKDQKFLMDSDVLNSFLKSGNERLIAQSLKQLAAKKELEASLGKLTGPSTTRALLLLSKQVSKEELVGLIESALDGSDGYTVVNVFESLHKLQFDESGFIAILKRVCHLKSGLPQNWKPIEAISKQIAKERNFQSHSSTVCQ